jgi:large repetitive protein
MAYRIVLGLLLAVSLAACNDNGNSTSSSSPNAAPVAPNEVPPAMDKPVISGTPPARAVTGQAYSFQPTAKDPLGRALTFSVANAPKWAAFNAASGHLAGTPSASETGAYPNITITASSGAASAVLPAFSIVVSAPTPAAGLSLSGTPSDLGGRRHPL